MIPRFLAATLLLAVASCATTPDGKLKDSIFSGYRFDVLPQIPAKISLQLSLLSVEEVDIVSGTARISVYLRHKWSDPRLAWTPKDFDGINVTTVHTDLVESRKIWIPEVYCPICFASHLHYTEARVSYTGDVSWTRFGSLSVLMPFTLRDFPFDSQDIGVSFFTTASGKLRLSHVQTDTWTYRFSTRSLQSTQTTTCPTRSGQLIWEKRQRARRRRSTTTLRRRGCRCRSACSASPQRWRRA